jgi:hypothetical protein
MAVVRTPLGQVALRLLTNLCGRASAFGCGQLNACAPRFGKADSNGLLRGARSMFTFADVVHFFANKFSGLS